MKVTLACIMAGTVAGTVAGVGDRSPKRAARSDLLSQGEKKKDLEVMW